MFNVKEDVAWDEATFYEDDWVQTEEFLGIDSRWSKLGLFEVESKSIWLNPDYVNSTSIFTSIQRQFNVNFFIKIVQIYLRQFHVNFTSI